MFQVVQSRHCTQLLPPINALKFVCFPPFLSDPGVPGLIFVSVSPRGFVDLTDVTLADEDDNSILTDNANRAIQGNETMQVTRPGGQL